jgi:hypothetical protein
MRPGLCVKYTKEMSVFLSLDKYVIKVHLIVVL